MITNGAKFFFGLAALAFFGAVAYGWGSHGGLTGVLTAGLYGGVGDHTGYIALLTAGVAAGFLGVVSIAFRDADAEAVEAVAHTDTLPEVPEPGTNSYWPVLGAVAGGCAVVGLIVSPQLFVFGVLVGIVVLLEWMVSAWADRSTGDPAVNRRIRNRLMNPIEIPIFGAIGVVAMVFCISRVLLALSANAATIVAIAFALLVLLGGSLLAVAPRSTRSIIAGLCIVVAVGVIAGGIISAAEGSRNYEKEHEESPFVPPDRNQPTPTTLPEN
jgi:hypothetical protein